MEEKKYLDIDEQEIVDYDTASGRVYDEMTWDDLAKHFLEGFQSGRYAMEEIWNALPEWMQIDIDESAFNYIWEYRFEEVGGKENA